MIKKTKQGFILRRLRSKLGECITWEVLRETLPDKLSRIAIIRQINDPWLFKKIGRQEFKVKYWLGTLLWETSHIIGPTRESLLNQILAELQYREQ